MPETASETRQQEREDGLRVETTAESEVVHRMSVTVPVPHVERAFDKTYRQLGKTARVRGFRPGKAPRSVLEKLYGPSICEDIEQQLVRETLPDAIELSELEPVVQPDVESRAAEPGEAFQYTARVEVMPRVELPDTDGLPIPPDRDPISEDEIAQRIDSLRESNAQLHEEPEDTIAAEGHSLTIDFVGRVDGESFEGGTGRDVTLEIGAGRFIPGFEEQLAGARSGDDVLVKVTFPEDYQEGSLAGKAAEFQVHVGSIRTRKVPELDDEFAKDLGFDTLDELRDKVRTELIDEREREERERRDRRLIDALIERADFEVPPGMIERQLHQQIQQMRRRFGDQVPAEILNQQLARIHAEGRPEAERRVREMFLLEAVAREEEIEISDEDVESRLDELAEAQGVDTATMRAMAEREGWDRAIRSELSERRALDFLASKASVEAPRDEDDEQEDAES